MVLRLTEPVKHLVVELTFMIKSLAGSKHYEVD
jgi:hypothetical protein